MLPNTGIKLQVQTEICQLAEKNHLNRVILFGSRARGDYWRASDIDLAVSGGDITRFSLDVEEETSTLLSYDVINLDETVSPELLARIQVQLRRAGAAEDAEVLRTGDLQLDTATHAVRVNDGVVHLTRTEYAILKLLMRNPGQVVARSMILDRICADTPDCTENSLRQHISNLRRKLREAGGREYIEAVWGIGFRLIPGERMES